jgi:hypothetical protein
MALEVLGWCRRRGELLLTLVLPDGTRSLVPAAWTDLHAFQDTRPPDDKRSQPSSLASRAELLHARTIVTALLQRPDAANTALPSVSPECSHAAAELSRTTAPAERRARVAQPRRGAAAGDAIKSR